MAKVKLFEDYSENSNDIKINDFLDKVESEPAHLEVKYSSVGEIFLFKLSLYSKVYKTKILTLLLPFSIF